MDEFWCYQTLVFYIVNNCDVLVSAVAYKKLNKITKCEVEKLKALKSEFLSIKDFKKVFFYIF